ncbi:PAS domain S-box protein [Lysobacter korlensis]|uniref:histidine kinase n=1 Tax=Lysobacter korlensis TaxID=553636 RepID=A0ABV6RIK2_9GAMM
MMNQALEYVPAPTWTADDDGSVDWVNSRFTACFGQADAVPAQWTQAVHPADTSVAEAAWRQAVASGEPLQVTVRLLVSGGLYRWFRCSARCHVQDGRRRWVGLHIDIDQIRRETELRQASLERMQLERERLRAMFAELPVAVTVYRGREHRIELMNRASIDLLEGRNLEGRTLSEAFPEVVEQGLVAMLDRVLETGETVQQREFPIRFDRSGNGHLELGCFDFSLQLLRDADGTPAGVLSCAVDVTAQVRSRSDLERLAAERAAVLEQLNVGIITTDEQGRIDFVNQRAYELHGVARLDVSPEDYAAAYALLREDDTPYPSEQLPLARAVMHDEHVIDARWKIRRPDGSVITVQGNARPIFDESGTKLGAVLTVHEPHDDLRA